MAVPRTVLLPHKEHPPNTSADSFTNLAYPIDWADVFGYPASDLLAGERRQLGDVYRVANADRVLRRLRSTRTL